MACPLCKKGKCTGLCKENEGKKGKKDKKKDKKKKKKKDKKKD